MNKIAVAAIIAAALICIGAAAAFVLTQSDDEKAKIAVTMPWEKTIVESIAGDDYRVVSMVGEGFDPHSSYSTPSNIADLYSSKIYFEIGSGVEWETAFLESVKSDIPASVRIVDLAGSIEYDPIASGHHHHEDGEEEKEDGEMDAHIWTSPAILKKIASAIADALRDLNPGRSSEYARNLSDFESKVGLLDAKAEKIADAYGSKETEIMVWHPAWGYMLGQYMGSLGMDLDMVSIEANGEVESAADAAAILSGENAKSMIVSPLDDGYAFRDALTSTYGIRVYAVNPTATDILKELGLFLDDLAEILGISLK